MEGLCGFELTVGLLANKRVCVCVYLRTFIERLLGPKCL